MALETADYYFKNRRISLPEIGIAVSKKSRIDVDKLDLSERVVSLNRVAKVVKGGRIFRFSVLVVVGDKNGHVGCGKGKAAEISDAIKKAIENAKKNLIVVPRCGTTLPHEIIGKYKAARVLIRPAKEGTGMIAGGATRFVLELAGIKDVRTKCLRSNNPKNVVGATISALESMITDDTISSLRSEIY